MQSYLDTAPNTSAEDAIRQAVVVVMGSLAKHLDADDPKVCLVNAFLEWILTIITVTNLVKIYHDLWFM